jgi:TetR/AcrR family transcriptional regulator, transcriptional repressor for nem operon
MKRSREEKAESHERIVEVAARRIRESGTDVPSVAEIMEAAGMTHGGFYKHFGSRDELIAEATKRACAEGSVRVVEMTEGAEDPFAALVTGYLSAQHRDDPGSGCAVAALSSDAARSGNPARAEYTAQVRRYVDSLQSLLPSSGSRSEDRDRSIAALSTLVGTLIVARAVDDEALADEILSAGCLALKGLSSLPN